MWDVAKGSRGRQDFFRCILLDNNLKISVTHGATKKATIRKFGRRVAEYHIFPTQNYLRVKCASIDSEAVTRVKCDALVAFKLTTLPLWSDCSIKIQDDRQCSGDRCFGWVTDAFAKDCNKGEKKPVESVHTIAVPMPYPVIRNERVTSPAKPERDVRLGGQVHINSFQDDMVEILRNMHRDLRKFTHETPTLLDPARPSASSPDAAPVLSPSPAAPLVLPPPAAPLPAPRPDNLVAIERCPRPYKCVEDALRNIVNILGDLATRVKTDEAIEQRERPESPTWKS